MKNERRKRDLDYITVTTIYIHLFGCVCLKTGTGGRDSRDPTSTYSDGCLGVHGDILGPGSTAGRLYYLAKIVWFVRFLFASYLAHVHLRGVIWKWIYLVRPQS
jgi:hypothetical protein